MGEYELLPDITMNNAPVYRNGVGCLYYNNNGNWAVNKDSIDPSDASYVPVIHIILLCSWLNLI